MVSLLPVQTSQCIAVLFFMTGSSPDNVIFSITNPYNSSSCKPGSWELVIPPDSQKRLLYWSSDFKYRWIGFSFSLFSSSLLFLISSSLLFLISRNDADIVAVRQGCKFTGWTGVSYDGEKIVVDAWQNDFWVVFARYVPDLSYCRSQTWIDLLSRNF